MSLESLPNEIFLELFEFLKTNEILNAFCCLNHRFNTLLLDHLAKYGLDLRSMHKKNFVFICREVLRSIASRIITLCLSDDDETPYQSKIFISNGLVLNQFISLKSLSIYEIRSGETLNMFIDELSNLSNLSNLKLIRCFVENVRPSCGTILNKIWSLPNLIQLYFDVTFQSDGYLAHIKTLSPSIKHLIIKGVTCCLFELSKLFECTRNLEYISIVSQDIDERPIMPINSSLITLELDVRCYQSMIMNILQKTSNLRHLKVALSDTYLNGQRWEQLINTYLPRLETLKFKMNFSCPRSNYQQTTNQLINSFKSQFWLEERKWYVRCHLSLVIQLCYVDFYTLPYAFSHFNNGDKPLYESTCPNTDDNYTYKQVKNLSCSNLCRSYYDGFEHPQFRFPNVRHLSAPHSDNNTFWTSVPELNKLQSLEIPGGATLSFIQVLLDRTTRLHSLILHDEMFTLRNTRIRRLTLLGELNFLNSKQCDELSHSSLVTRCEVLSIKIVNEMCLLPLLKYMRHLHALKIQCQNDNWTLKRYLANDTIVETLRSYLPSTAEIGRDPKFESYIRIWMF